MATAPKWYAQRVRQDEAVLLHIELKREPVCVGLFRAAGERSVGMFEWQLSSNLPNLSFHGPVQGRGQMGVTHMLQNKCFRVG